MVFSKKCGAWKNVFLISCFMYFFFYKGGGTFFGSFYSFYFLTYNSFNKYKQMELTDFPSLWQKTPICISDMGFYFLVLLSKEYVRSIQNKIAN